MSESVYSMVSKAKLMTAIDDNKKGARKALWLVEHYERLLSVILIGNNLVNIAISTLGLRVFLMLFESNSAWVDVLNTGVITLIVLIFGEILPKTRGRASTEKLACKYSGLMYVIYYILTPIAFPFYKLNAVCMTKMDIDPQNVTSGDLENIIDSMEDNGEIEEEEADMLQKVLDLSHIEIKDIMTPRVDVVALSIDSSVDEIKKCFFENQYSRVPIYEGTIDHIIGILYEKEFFKALIQNPKISSIKRLLNKPLFVVGSMRADSLLSLLKKENVHQAIVLDEYGGFDGVVTMEDTLEELVGEIFDEHDEVPFTIQEINENEYLVSGDLEIEGLFDYFSFDDDKENIESSTVGGWVQDKLERVAVVGDEAEFVIVSNIDYNALSQDEGYSKKKLKFKVNEILNNRITVLSLILEDYEETNIDE